MSISKTLANQVAAAVRSVAQAGSANLGRDCIWHAMAAQHLLVGEGVANVQFVAGHAVWRVHPQHPSAVVSHHPGNSGVISTEGLLFHTWVACGDQVFDTTTYQLKDKLAALDALDGSRTPASWNPDYLLRARAESVDWRAVRDGSKEGLFCYEQVQDLTIRVVQHPSSRLAFYEAAILDLAMNLAKQGRPFAVIGPCGQAAG